ncbi:MAG: hypothetical protein N2322_06855, partial [Terrimicrobiaceae bacterium]|nr:hypothetical protein [Terrimicrobiaceae bacterium]
MAEALFRAAAGSAFSAASAGVSAASGQPASREAVEVLAEQGIDLSGFRSQPVSEKLLGEASVVFAMTRDHQRLLDLFFPEHSEKVMLLREPLGDGKDISD